MVECDALSPKCLDNIEIMLSDIKDNRERKRTIKYFLDFLNKKFGYEVQSWWRLEYYRKQKEGSI